MFTQFRRYSPNSKCRPSSSILAVLAMFLGSSLAIILFCVNCLKCSALFSNTTQPCPPGPSLAFHFSVIYVVLLTPFSTQQMLNVFQLWSMLAGYSLVFICWENPKRSGTLLFPDCPKFYRLMKTRNRRYPRSSGMDGDNSGESGAFLFSRRVPDFYDGRRSFPTNENSNSYRQGRRRWISLIYQPSKLLGSSLPIIHFGVLSISRQIQ